MSKRAEWRLEMFLYLLIRDHLPIGRVEEILKDMKAMDEAEVITYSSKVIRDFTHELLQDLKIEIAVHK